MEINDLNPKIIQAIFWEAMQNGWANKNFQKQTNPLLPGYKLIPYRSGKFYVLDAYCTNPISKNSDGSMKIWFEDIPIWIMNYGGIYPKRVIPFLKLALLANVELRNFVGGRGPKSFVHKDYPDLSYLNTVPKDMDSFNNFCGTECICENGHNVGQHYYRGISLI